MVGENKADAGKWASVGFSMQQLDVIGSSVRRWAVDLPRRNVAFVALSAKISKLVSPWM